MNDPILYTVIAKLKSPSSEPVDMPWATKVTAIEAAVAVTQLLAQTAQMADSDMPASIQTQLIEVRVEVVS